MKKIMCISLICCMLLGLVGCKKCISTETKTVQVQIVDQHHTSSYTTVHPNPVTHSMFTMVHPATYCITVEYDGVKYKFTEEDIYDKYHDKVGEYINGKLVIKKYDNGTIKYVITEIGD